MNSNYHVAWPCLTASTLVICVATTFGEPPKGVQVQTQVIPIPDSESDFSVWEPHVIADDSDPRRILVAAICGEYLSPFSGRKPVEKNIRAWQSFDGGQTWSKLPAPFGSNGQASRFCVDPVVAFDGSRTGWLVGCQYDFAEKVGLSKYTAIKVASLKEGRKDWQSTVVVNEIRNDDDFKAIVDKPWLVVDKGSADRKGTVYVAWTKIDLVRKRCELWCTALAPGSSSFSQAVELGEAVSAKGGHMLSHGVQLAVRPDGKLDAIWQVPVSKQIVHAFSTNGAKSFSNPASISADRQDTIGEFPSMVALPGGNLMAAWKNQESVFCSVYSSGRWSPPRLVTGESKRGVRFSHPVMAAAGGALWLLAYCQEDQTDQVSVVLFRSNDFGRTWSRECILATREFTSLMSRRFSPGDYVGLASSKDVLFAAYSLPPAIHERTMRLYVATIRVKTP